MTHTKKLLSLLFLGLFALVDGNLNAGGATRRPQKQREVGERGGDRGGERGGERGGDLRPGTPKEARAEALLAALNILNVLAKADRLDFKGQKITSANWATFIESVKNNKTEIGKGKKFHLQQDGQIIVSAISSDLI